MQMTRQQLYDWVWSKPLPQLAQRTTLSEKSITGLCRRLLVPSPPRGYWSSVAKGTPLPRPPLPALPNESFIEVPAKAPARPATQAAAPVSRGKKIVRDKPLILQNGSGSLQAAPEPNAPKQSARQRQVTSGQTARVGKSPRITHGNASASDDTAAASEHGEQPLASGGASSDRASLSPQRIMSLADDAQRVEAGRALLRRLRIEAEQSPAQAAHRLFDWINEAERILFAADPFTRLVASFAAAGEVRGK